ncbi:hypothetical protein RHSIM_Rhsim09G0012300 [Rhododendron simsii]|uniref:Uncharacterized protein n=1 Tax=Rhododendron simsii TaxID=118357 RepID=A0A834LEH7_RHOSS|nr:hypothetical protein RHSIM_Rhsim09G0012300 [Rhododendron simsii]
MNGGEPTAVPVDEFQLQVILGWTSRAYEVRGKHRKATILGTRVPLPGNSLANYTDYLGVEGIASGQKMDIQTEFIRTKFSGVDEMLQREPSRMELHNIEFLSNEVSRVYSEVSELRLCRHPSSLGLANYTVLVLPTERLRARPWRFGIASAQAKDGHPKRPSILYTEQNEGDLLK